MTVLEPYADAPSVRGITATEGQDAITVTVERAAGKDTFTLAAALDGAVTVKRAGADGQVAWEETAKP